MEDDSQQTTEGKKPGAGPRPSQRVPDLGRLERKAKPHTPRRKPSVPPGPARAAPPTSEPPQEPSWAYPEREPLRLERQLAMAGRRAKIHLTETDEGFLRRYSFGTACGFYMMNRALWPFLIFVVLVGLSPLLIRAPVWFVAVTVVLLLIYPPGFTFLCILAGPVSYSAPYLMQGPIRNLMVGGGIIFYLAAGVYTLLLAVAGVYARRQRWQNWDWPSFADFEEMEKRWQVFGIIFWLVLVGSAVYVFATNGFEELFPLFWGSDFA